MTLPVMALAVPPPIPKVMEVAVPLATGDFEASWRRITREARLEWRAWVLSVDGRWFECVAMYSQNGSTLTIRTKGNEHVANGMSGSPVITDEGAAMALVSTSGSNGMTQGPGLIDALPGWLLDIVLGDANPRRRS